MGRPRKNRVVEPAAVETPTTPVESVSPAKTKAQLTHEELVKNFNAPEDKPEAATKNDSLKNLNSVLDSTSVDEMFEAAKKDPTIIQAKSSIPEFENNVDEPPKSPLVTVPDDVTLVGQKLTKGDEDSPFFVAAEDPGSRMFTVFDFDTDRPIADLFYANRSTGTIIVFVREADKNMVVEIDGKPYPILILKNRRVYFKRSIKA